MYRTTFLILILGLALSSFTAACDKKEATDVTDQSSKKTSVKGASGTKTQEPEKTQDPEKTTHQVTAHLGLWVQDEPMMAEDPTFEAMRQELDPKFAKTIAARTLVTVPVSGFHFTDTEISRKEAGKSLQTVAKIVEVTEKDDGIHIVATDTTGKKKQSTLLLRVNGDNLSLTQNKAGRFTNTYRRCDSSCAKKMDEGDRVLFGDKAGKETKNVVSLSQGGTLQLPSSPMTSKSLPPTDRNHSINVYSLPEIGLGISITESKTQGKTCDAWVKDDDSEGEANMKREGKDLHMVLKPRVRKECDLQPTCIYREMGHRSSKEFAANRPYKEIAGYTLCYEEKAVAITVMQLESGLSLQETTRNIAQNIVNSYRASGAKP